MNKTIFTRIVKCMLVTVASIVCYQSGNAQFRYGPTAGVNFTNYHFRQDIVPISHNVGAQAGIQAEMMFPGIGFGLDLGLIYNMTGAHVDLGERKMWASQGYGNENLLIHQIVLPFHLRFKYTNLQGLEEIIAPFAYAGPDININVAHAKCDAMTFAGGDVGLSFGLGAELWKQFQISGCYSMGMTYAVKAKVLQEYSARTRQWSIRMTYFF